jgi:DNA (cytosine-5)-methyltransferase 1
LICVHNVPGLLSHAQGQTYTKILNALSDLRYHVEWQMLDSKDFGVPQSRKRLFAFGYIDPECAGKVLPILECNSQTLRQIIGGSQGQRVYDPRGLSCTLTSGSGGQGGKTGLYFIDLNIGGKITEIARCIKSRYNSGLSKRMSENSGVLELESPMPLLTPGKEKKRQNGKRYRLPDEPMFTLTASDRHGVLLNGSIRKLMPEECLRLQG